MALHITPLRKGFVAEAVGVTGSTWDERDGNAVKEALIDHSVVIIRGMEITPREHVALTRVLGEPEPVTDMRNHHPESVDILVVDNSARTPVVGNQCWHSDRSFLPEPTRFTLLRAEVVPPRGGDTLFADMVGAYKALPDAWKDQLWTATGIHTYDKIARLRSVVHKKPIEQGYEAKYPPVRHPVVRAHPETGTAALYLNELCLARIESEDGVPIDIPVDAIHAHATDKAFVHHHRWQTGDLVIWDNSRVLHRADELAQDLPRVLHRTTTADGPPIHPRLYVEVREN